MARGARAAGRLAGPDVGVVCRAPHAAHRPCDRAEPAVARPPRPAYRGHRTWVRCARRRLSFPARACPVAGVPGIRPPVREDAAGAALPPNASALHGPLRGRYLRAARRTLTRRAALVRPRALTRPAPGGARLQRSVRRPCQLRRRPEPGLSATPATGIPACHLRQRQRLSGSTAEPTGGVSDRWRRRQPRPSARHPVRRPGTDTPRPSSPRLTSRMGRRVIVGSSGRGVPPAAHADACGRKTRPPKEHNDG